MVGIISTVGFPIAACIWLLRENHMRTNKIMDDYAKSLTSVTENMKEITQVLNEIKGYINSK